MTKLKQFSQSTYATSGASGLAINSVIRNTYMLLSMTLVFSAIMAGVSMMLNVPPLGFMTVLIYFGLFFLVAKTAETAMGIVSVFALTGFLGFTLGPLLNSYIGAYSNGGQLVMTALGGTGIIFFGLSGYTLTTRKDFSYLAGFLFVGGMVAFLAGIASFFFQVPAFSLAVSSMFILISSGYILFETSQLINGGQRNYILATVSIYMSLYNMFVSLLQILAAFAGNRE